MKQKIQTVGEMVMRSHYLNALDIESKAETSLSDMERQDFINTINDLRSSIESLRLTIATLQRTIAGLHDGEKRYKRQASEYEEKIADLSRQCEYLESLNKRHCKNRFSGKTLSRKNRTENKKKGRDEEKQDYVDTSSRNDSDTSDKGDAGTDTSQGSTTSE